ncbi:transporter substrate-binding domain-containing protein [Pseudomonas sp. MS19]|uniref:transporter substrate-binding domain-containing protein n=1 Tax=Pseudomonas sp. MS19 TaxID=2579939 RepID=UPI001562AFB3|nr:transporter substrate-binding domain-containing protein [Pseudomonas sp. MS19]
MHPSYLCGICIAVFAGNTAAQSYVVGVEAVAFAPHYSVDKHGQFRGFARELFDGFAADSGVELIYKPLPVEQLLPALFSGEVDFKYPDNPTWTASAKAGSALVYSADIVESVDGVLVAPGRVGRPQQQLQRLAIVNGWTPQGFAAQPVDWVANDDLRSMINQALKKDTDGAYYNVVVATHYLDTISTRPGALVFDPSLPYTRIQYQLSTRKQPQVIASFDRYLSAHASEVAALKRKYRVEANLDSEYLGMEQWKVDFLKRQKARAETAQQSTSPE